MEVNIFSDKSVKPDNIMLSETLGDKMPLWETIKRHISETYGPTTEDWKFYGAKLGWTHKVLLKKRNLFFFTAYDGYFAMTFVFGDKAVAAAEQSDLPGDIIDSLKNARKYAEGRGIQIIVTQPPDVETIKKLIAIKIKN